MMAILPTPALTASIATRVTMLTLRDTNGAMSGNPMGVLITRFALMIASIRI